MAVARLNLMAVACLNLSEVGLALVAALSHRKLLDRLAFVGRKRILSLTLTLCPILVVRSVTAP